MYCCDVKYGSLNVIPSISLIVIPAIPIVFSGDFLTASVIRSKLVFLTSSFMSSFLAIALAISTSTPTISVPFIYSNGAKPASV